MSFSPISVPLRYSAVVLLLLLMFLRFFMLDMDAPANNITGITHPDESYYTFLAVHEQVKSKPGFPQMFHQPSNAVLHLHSYIPTKLGLWLFGNNYYGLRFAPVFLSLIAIFLIARILAQFYFQNKRSFSFIFILIAVFLLADPYYFIVSRYQNPMIYVTLWHAVGIFLLFKYTQTSRYWYLFASVFVFLFCIVFVYPYAIFGAMGISFFVLYQAIAKRSWKYFFTGLSAGLLALLILIVVFQLFGYSISDYFNYIFKFKAQRDEMIAAHHLLSFRIFLAPLQIIYTNLMRYNPLLLFSLHIFILYCLLKWKSINSFEKFVFIVLLCAFIQTTFILSYPFKKWSILFPFLALTVIPSIRFIVAARNMKMPIRISILLLSLICVILSVKNSHVNNQREYWMAFEYGFEYLQPSFIIKYLAPIFSVLFFLLIVIHLFVKELDRFEKIVYGAALLCCFVFIYETIFKNRTFDYRNMLIQNAKLLDNKIIIGDLSHAYTFYNSSVALVNPYAEEIGMDMRLAKNISKLDPARLIYIGCYRPSQGKPADSIDRYQRTFKLIENVPGKMYSFGIYAIPSK